MRSIASIIADTLAASEVIPFPLVTVFRPGAASGRMLWKTGMPRMSRSVTSATLVIPHRDRHALASVSVSCNERFRKEVSQFSMGPQADAGNQYSRGLLAISGNETTVIRGQFLPF